MHLARLATVALAALVPAQDPVPTPAASREPVVIECTDEDGKPVAGAEVYLYQRVRLPDGTSENRQFGPFSSDAEGRASCPVALTYDGGKSSRWAYCRVPGRLVGTARSIVSSTPAPEVANPAIAVRLCASRKVRGAVRAPEGTDLSRVRVQVLSMYVLDGKNMTTWGGKTIESGSAVPRALHMRGLEATLPEIFECAVNADGTFALGDVPTRVRLYLGADGPGVGHAQYANLVFPDGWVEVAEPVTIEMVPEAILAGTLSEPEGSPIPGAQVHARMKSAGGGWHHLSSFATTTDARGHFRLGGLSATTFDVTVDAGGRPWRLRPLRLQLKPGELRDDVGLTMETGVKVSGVVVEADTGAPVAGVSVIAITDDEPYARLEGARSDDDGSFELLLPRGIARLYLGGLPTGFTAPTGQVLEEIDVQDGAKLELRFEVDKQQRDGK